MPVYPTIEKWMKEDNVRRYESANSSFTDEMLDECLMIDYISSDEKRTEQSKYNKKAEIESGEFSYISACLAGAERIVFAERYKACE